MQITSKNFENYLPKIKESIKRCDFLSFDTEFTGILNKLKLIKKKDKFVVFFLDKKGFTAKTMKTIFLIQSKKDIKNILSQIAIF